ncbi:hypothetical protein AVEN_51147-1 [Araneus ventricosus]|uniref:Uncharacterized protein n=1 Tax=Araneus ventricosus TaxID=182803 RepID=A0A4Y2I9Y0_ARAVE|nr:hypothetical protein AVEN_51147-1 [Araneus ventricosus]
MGDFAMEMICGYVGRRSIGNSSYSESVGSRFNRLILHIPEERSRDETDTILLKEQKKIFRRATTIPAVLDKLNRKSIKHFRRLEKRKKLSLTFRSYIPVSVTSILILKNDSSECHTNLEYADKTFLVMDRASLYLHVLAANSLCNSQMRSDWRRPVLNMKVKTFFLWTELCCLWSENNLDGWRSENKKNPLTISFFPAAAFLLLY